MKRLGLRRVIGAVVALTLLVACTNNGPPRATPSTPASSATTSPIGGGVASVRVNQIGYATTSHAKQAYLMASEHQLGASFTVQNSSGDTVLTGRVGDSVGGWSRRYKYVYPLDFDAVTTPGTYTIHVNGSAPATSPTFRIDAAPALYAQALANSLSFYQVQRDGPDFIPGPLRTAPGHLNDAHAITYDTPHVNGDGVFSGDLSAFHTTRNAAGGWWDAGDYLKFVQTTSFTVDLLMLGVRDFPAQMGPESPSSNFTAEAKFGARWLLRMWDDRSQTLYYQVGIGSGNNHIAGDHDIWRLPQRDDTYGRGDPTYRYIRHRPVFRAGAPGSPISPNLAGRDAAALAESYQVFKTSDPKFANKCLLAAEHIFDLADTSPKGHLLTVIPFDFYPESEWRDDLELGATELAMALAEGGAPASVPHSDPALYLRQAAHWARAYITGPNDAADTLNLYDVSGLAHFELYRALTQAGDPSGLDVTKGQLLADLRKQLEGALKQGTKDPFGFGFPWGTYDTTAHGAGLSVMASEYDQLISKQDFADQSQEWLANILG
ncbi:MAG TPA: glycoside hydrolase family 9 protein, partial [Actinomycetota bacterium]|nr:glycoside hydrolase family 9 protein [Actinomycetota bacterium]